MTVSEEMLSHIFRYGGKCRECSDHFNVCPKSGMSCDPDKAKETIAFVLEARDHYLAMKAAEPLQQGDEVREALIAARPYVEQAGFRHHDVSELLAKIDAALVRSKLPIGDDVRLREAARNARAWVFECWGWLMETDLDLKCPMEVDPLDIVEQIDAVLGIDPAITAIGSQSIEGERAK